MNILIACEFSGRVRDAFTRRGHDAWSCDLLPSETPGQHLQGDVRQMLSSYWDLLIAHPPCTRLCNSGVRWLNERDLWEEMREAAEFFKLFINAPIKHICVENPIPHHYALDIIGRKYDQVVHPWQFGHAEMKSTCLWLNNLPELQPTNIVGPPPPTGTEERKSWERVWRMPPKGWNGDSNRMKERSRTYIGIAEAMADQWNILE